MISSILIIKYPIWLMEDIASICFILIWLIATELPSIILEITNISKIKCPLIQRKREKIIENSND
jgi:hypothetical protein